MQAGLELAYVDQDSLKIKDFLWNINMGLKDKRMKGKGHSILKNNAHSVYHSPKHIQNYTM